MGKNKVKFIAVIFTAAISLFIAVCSANAAFFGDIDSDKAVTAEDARKILRVSVGLDTLDEKLSIIADTDGDGKITAADARLALRTSVQLETKMPLYDSEVEKEPTCTEKGVMRRITTEKDYTPLGADKPLPNEYNEEIPALGHDFTKNQVVEKVEPTCKESPEGDGYIIKKCDRCGENVKEILKGGHVWVPPTCTKDGYCERCNAPGEKALGHTTNLGVCERCKEHIDIYPEATAVIKEKYASAKTNITAAYGEIQKSIDEIPFLDKHAEAAKPLYVQAKADFEAAAAACADIPELQELKAHLTGIANKITLIAGQIEVITSVGGIDENNYYTLIGVIDDNQWAVEALIKKADKILAAW